MTDEIYQNLVVELDKKAPESVHLCLWPEVDEKAIDKKLENEMDLAYSLVKLGRSARNSANIKNRQPLSKMLISVDTLPEYYGNIVKEELNVKEVDLGANMNEYVHFEIKPNLPVLGKEYGKLIPRIKEEIANTENTTDTTADSSKVETSSNETQTSTDTNTEKTEQTNTTKTMYVNSQSVNLRQKADKTSQVIKSLTLNTKVTVLSSTNGWAYVDVNGTKGYVAENLLTSTQKETSRSGLTTREQASSNTTNAASSNNASTSSSIANVANKTESTTSLKSGSSVVSYAKQFLGCKYVYGGTSPSGFDCSGFTQYVYKHFGVNLNRTAAAQYSNGKSVTSLQAGDLVMFGKSGINHVGIYIGGNTFIHAANKSQGVRTDSMSTGYYKTNYVGARRIF